MQGRAVLNHPLQVPPPPLCCGSGSCSIQSATCVLIAEIVAAHLTATSTASIQTGSNANSLDTPPVEGGRTLRNKFRSHSLQVIGYSHQRFCEEKSAHLTFAPTVQDLHLQSHHGTASARAHCASCSQRSSMQVLSPSVCLHRVCSLPQVLQALVVS